jgi:hypothetical protein
MNVESSNIILHSASKNKLWATHSSKGMLKPWITISTKTDKTGSDQFLQFTENFTVQKIQILKK